MYNLFKYMQIHDQPRPAIDLEKRAKARAQFLSLAIRNKMTLKITPEKPSTQQIRTINEMEKY